MMNTKLTDDTKQRVRLVLFAILVAVEGASCGHVLFSAVAGDAGSEWRLYDDSVFFPICLAASLLAGFILKTRGTFIEGAVLCAGLGLPVAVGWNLAEIPRRVAINGVAEQCRDGDASACIGSLRFGEESSVPPEFAAELVATACAEGDCWACWLAVGDGLLDCESDGVASCAHTRCPGD